VVGCTHPDHQRLARRTSTTHSLSGVYTVCPEKAILSPSASLLPHSILVLLAGGLGGEKEVILTAWNRSCNYLANGHSAAEGGKGGEEQTSLRRSDGKVRFASVWCPHIYPLRPGIRAT